MIEKPNLDKETYWKVKNLLKNSFKNLWILNFAIAKKVLVNGYLSSQLTWNSQNLMQAKINKRTFNEAFPPISALRRHFRN